MSMENVLDVLVLRKVEVSAELLSFVLLPLVEVEALVDVLSRVEILGRRNCRG